LAAGFGRLLRLIRKELSESLRDRRTILTLVLMPLLLYPVLAMAFQQVMLSRRLEDKPSYRIGFASEEQAKEFRRFWRAGTLHLIRRHASGAKDEAPGLPVHLRPEPELTFFLPGNLEEAIRTGDLDVGVRVRGKAAPFKQGNSTCEFIYREGSVKGREAARLLEILTADANAAEVNRRLNHLRSAEGLEKELANQRGDPVRVRITTITDPNAKKSDLTPVLVPLILILMTMTGAVYPAIDLTAGERERGTLEILVAAPIPRLTILLAKYAAVFTVAMLTALVNVGSMTLTLQVTGIGKLLFAHSLNPLVLLEVLALLVLFAAFFSAVALTLTSFARSFKEAQAYLIPLMLLCLTPGMMALLPGLSLRGPLAVVPLINIVLLARDVFAGSANPAVAGIVVTTTLLYAVAAVALAARVFGTEAVLSAEASSWSDLLRRPREPRTAAEPAAALLCLACMFPAYFLLNNGLARIDGLDVAGRLVLSGLASVLLFVAFPMTAAWLGRVQLRTGLRWFAPGWQACAAAILLGVCLWPFVHEVILMLRQAGFSTLRAEQLDQVREVLEKYRKEHSPLLIVVVLALVPAVVEELFFRGYLFTALLGEGDRPWRAIFASAALFASFHLLVTDALAVERLPTSLLLGVVLGWLCYQSGSIVPGMILHALHNGSLVLMGYYEPQLNDLGWVQSAEDHLPAWLLGAAAAGVVLGGILVWRLKAPRRRETAPA
jgi:ABC-2 type transport system permease protein/sodium transport system permease protein